MKGLKNIKKLLCITVPASIAMCGFNFTNMTVSATEAWDGTADISWYSKEASEFTLETSSQLAGLAALVNEEKDSFDNKTILLGANIDFYPDADAEGWSNGKNIPEKGWQPIGIVYETPFKGVFDGCGYSISGIYTMEAESVAGLFGYVGSGSEIKNLSLNNSYIYSMNRYSGGICAYNNYADITNCHNNAKTCSDYYIAGGITGVNLGGHIQYCSNTGSVAGGKGSGGIAGECIAGTLNSSYNSGRSGSATTSGGICGYMNDSNIRNTYNIGEVSGIKIAGGITGSTNGSNSINNSYNIGNVKSKNGVSCGISGEKNVVCSECYYLNSTAEKDCAENTESISKEMLTEELVSKLGESFVNGESFPVLVWQNKIDNPPVTTETTPSTTTTTSFTKVTTTTIVTKPSVTSSKKTTTKTTTKTTPTITSKTSDTTESIIKIWAINNVTELSGIGSTVQLLIDGNTSMPQWATMNKNIAVVDKNGLVTAKGEGKATIVATVDGVAVTIDITVTAKSSATTTTTTTTTTTMTTTTIKAYSLGDCDGNNKIDISDATIVLTYYAQNAAGLDALFNEDEKLNMLAFYAADTNRDGNISIEDATLILRYYAHAAAGLKTDWNK